MLGACRFIDSRSQEGLQQGVPEETRCWTQRSGFSKGLCCHPLRKDSSMIDALHRSPIACRKRFEPTTKQAVFSKKNRSLK